MGRAPAAPHEPAQAGFSRGGETVLRIAPGLESRLNELGQVELSWDGRTRWFPARALTVIGVFITPLSLADGLQALANLARGPELWAELAHLTRDLQFHGALRADATDRTAPRAHWE